MMEKRLGSYDVMPWNKKSQQPVKFEIKRKSGWDQYPITTKCKTSQPANEVRYSRKQSESAKHSFRKPYHKRDNSSIGEQYNLTSNDESTKLLVSNVHFTVTDSDILELFGEFKSLKFSKVNYDSSGRPLGSAELVFGKRADAMKAIELYHDAKLDGRKLNIQEVNPEILATRPFKRAVKFIPTFRRFRKCNGNLKFQDGPDKKSCNHKAKPYQVTAKELDAQLDQIVKDKRKTMQ